MSDTSTGTTRSPAEIAKLVVGAVLLVLLVLFVVANTQRVTIDFLFAEVRNVPLILVLLVTAVIGGAITELFRFTLKRRS